MIIQLLCGIITIGIMSVGMFIGLSYISQQQHDPQHIKEVQFSSQVYNHTQILLNKNPIDCNDLHYLRQGHITYKHWYNDTLPNQIQLNKARDLWNTNNCGLHWGYWEN